MASGAKNEGEPRRRALIPLRALSAALGSVPTVALSSALRQRSVVHNQRTLEINQRLFVTVSVRRLAACEPLRLPASSIRRLDLAGNGQATE